MLQGQVALVTGGGTGIGAVISHELARHGAQVAIASRDPEHHRGIIGEIESLGQEALALSADVRRPDQVQTMVQQVLDKFGRLDILVNNAAGNFLCAAEQLSYNGWKAVVDIVLNGSFIVSQAVLPSMKTQKGGNIINIGATYAWLAAPYLAHSGAAKAGVLNLTRTLAVEWAGYGIRVNAVTPGPIEGTEGVSRLMGNPQVREATIRSIPLRRLGKKEEIAWAILYLLSPAAAYVTGHNLVVDGGMCLGSRQYGAEGQGAAHIY
ncbi:MAG TPA: SDR family oxidoreductase [Candidatus Fraserbacteria bacterium]|nr:SDR family oxidoreductase [Candidatus Fraserbacteria bacterium]